MNIKQALSGVKGNKLRQSESTYEGTDTPICYLSLSKEWHDQDYLVLSETAAKNLLAKPEEERVAFLATLDVTYSDDAECWGIVMPQSTKVLGEIDF